MISRRRAAALAATCLVLFAAAALAQEGRPAAPDVPPGNAVVSGQLVHKTRPELAASADVLLYALSADGNAGLRQGKTDAQGRFRFEGVSNAPDVVYLVGARAGEIPFGTRFAFARGETEHHLELALSDPITDPSRADVRELELRVERGCTHLHVSHRHPLANRGDRVVFIPPPARASAAPLFEVELPEAADGFEAVAGGEGLVRDGRRVRFWGPLYPGEQTVEFDYALPLAASALALGFPSGAPGVSVLAPPGVVTVSSDALRAAPERTIDGQRYAAARSGAIAAGGSLALAVTTQAQAPSPVRTPRAELWLELDDAALEVDARIEVVAEGAGAPLVSAASPLLCFPLPKGTGELRFSSETLAAGLRRDPSGDLAIHGPLPRGASQLALSYRLPATSAGVELTQSFDRLLPLLSVLVADNGVVADTPRLHRRRSAQVADRNYLHLEAFAVEPGEAIEIGLRRTAPAAAGGRVVPAGFALFAGLAALGFLIRPLRGAPSGAQRGESEQSLESGEQQMEREAIVRSLEVLDEDLETGKISPEDHAHMRTELRARAAQLLLAKRAEPPASGVDQQSAPDTRPAPRFCSACGAGVRPSDAFCSQCGSRLTT